MSVAALPPGPRLPRAVQTVGWVTRPLGWLERCRDRYGDAFTLRMASEPAVVLLSDPAAVRDVFTGSPDVFRAGEGNALLEPLVGPGSLLLLDGRRHLAERRLLLPAFHGERLAAQRALMAQVAREEIASWPDGEPFAAQPRMQALTLEIILRVVLGVARDDPRAVALRAALRRMLGAIMDPRLVMLIFLAGPRRADRLPLLRRILVPVDRLLHELIRDRRAQAGVERDEDVLALLLCAHHEDGRPMTDDELRDELVTLLVAGHETTATALSWALERLLRHPEALGRLRDGDEAYADAVVKETLRLRSPITIVARRLTEDADVGGLRLPAGCVVAPCAHLVHRRPDLYPEPLAFRPERFLDRPPGTYTWIPFGGGVRRCIGAAFAEQEMRVVLGELVRARGGLRVDGPAPERVVRRAIVMAPEHGGRLVAGRA
ncbi:cytochrome P450 [Conexibacter sp. SYSU D00693]|uniref:cytochrome P450 n=1 Tax=Conexibacter sp. SYSU D00693 TaxID=2812560 RepID=UPI00196A4FE9|nr:cytochrome P450 [Conexibacter sp. SYSU D00693]